MMTVTVSFVGSSEETTLSYAFEDSAGRRVLKQDLKMIVVKGRHCGPAFLTLQNDDKPQLTQEPIHVWRQYRCDDRATTTTEQFRL